MSIKSVAVFCGSKAGHDPIYLEVAKELGERLAHEQITLVYGGAQVGLMGAIADACLASNGKVVGVIPEKLKKVEIAHLGLTQLHVVKTMHERKAKMADLADAFVALPGGAGTLEEWFEVFTWAQLGYHHKPCCLLNVNRFFDPLIAMLDHIVKQGFMTPVFRKMIIIESTIEGLIASLNSYARNDKAKWD